MYSLFCFMKQLIYRKTCESIKCRPSEKCGPTRLLLLGCFSSAASPRLLLLGCCSDEQHVITPDENLAEFAGHLSVDEFLCVGELEVHVGVCGDEETGVLHAPLESDGHLFPGEFREEWFGVDWDKLRCRVVGAVVVAVVRGRRFEFGGKAWCARSSVSPFLRVSVSRFFGDSAGVCVVGGCVPGPPWWGCARLGWPCECGVLRWCFSSRRVAARARSACLPGRVVAVFVVLLGRGFLVSFEASNHGKGCFRMSAWRQAPTC